MKLSTPAAFRGYRLRVWRVTVAGHGFELLGPAGEDELLDRPAVAQRFERSGYLPYWAQLWPASLLLAEAVAAWKRPRAGAPRVLDLGCGLGLISLLLSRLGYHVVAADCDVDALAFVGVNARRNGVDAPRTWCLDWQRPPPGPAFDRIVAADVLYEQRHLAPVAELVRRRLRPDGLALIADPNRSTADDFAAVARRSGLLVAVRGVAVGVQDGRAPVRGRLFELRRES